MKDKPITPNQHDLYKTRLLQSLELMELGYSLMRQNIIRRNPNASESFINSEMTRWLMEQPERFFVGQK